MSDDLPAIKIEVLDVVDGCLASTVARATIPGVSRSAAVLAFRIAEEVADCSGWTAIRVDQHPTEHHTTVTLGGPHLVQPAGSLADVMRGACERSVRRRTSHPLGISTHRVEVLPWD